MSDHPHDRTADPLRRKRVLLEAMLGTINDVGIMCGENFITHDEHEQIMTILGEGAQRDLNADDTLIRLDFGAEEP